MADWPQLSFGGRMSHAMQAAASGLPSVTLTGGAAHTKAASWSELIASTEHTASAILFQAGNNNWGTQRNYFIDIAIGAAGAEVVLIPDLWVSVSGALAFSQLFLVPVAIPKGARLSARCSCSSASGTATVSCQLFSDDLLRGSPKGPVVMYGGTVANSGGVMPAVSANAEGAWSQLVAATTFHHSHLMLSAGKLYSDIGMNAERFAVDIGIGASGQERELITDIPLGSSTALDLPRPSVVGPIPTRVPKGSRLALRLRGSGGAAESQYVLHGMG
jgi:hypothetical protein